MSQTTHRQIYLKTKPRGALSLDDFEMREAPLPVPKEGEVLIKGLYISLDAANRAWMQGATYREEIGAGDVMAGGVLGEVVETKSPRLAVGDLIEGDCGWQEYAARPAHQLIKRRPHDPLTHLLSVLGITGKTAYFGMLEIGRPKPGETVLVSAAAGAVGSIAAQLARMAGARVIGMAGSDEKCAWLKDTLKLDETINYKSGNLFEQMRKASPQGIDVYFDNTGGDILEAALFAMRNHGRIICCGGVSQYDGPAPQSGPRGVPGLVVVKRLRLQGFVVMDYMSQYARAETELAGWAKSGALVVAEDVLDGIDKAPEALIGLLAGKNTGKRMVRLA